jgi:dolichol-phosphate mannosyltransferase
MMSWSIIIFCYNEAWTLGKVIEDCIAFLNMNGASDSEIIIVDDGSTDITQDVCQEYLSDFRIRVIRHTTNLGIGAALKTGYKEASKTYICAIPGDGQFDINELKQVPCFEKKFFYSFYRPKKNYSIFRSLLSFLNNILNKYFLGVKLKDVNWIKAYHSEQIQGISIKLNSSLIESEICAKLIWKGCVPIEIPSIYHPREAGKSKGANIYTLLKAGKEISKLYFRMSCSYFRPRG